MRVNVWLWLIQSSTQSSLSSFLSFLETFSGKRKMGEKRIFIIDKEKEDMASQTDHKNKYPVLTKRIVFLSFPDEEKWWIQYEVCYYCKKCSLFISLLRTNLM